MGRWALATLALVASTLVAVPAGAQSDSEPELIRVIVTLDVDNAPAPAEPTAAAIAVRAAVRSAQRQVEVELDGTRSGPVKRFTHSPAVAVAVTQDGLDALARSDVVTSVIPDVPHFPSLDSSVPVMQGDQAHAQGFNGAGGTIVLIDTGVETSHSFLGGRVVAEACFNLNNNCPNGQDEMIGPGAGGPCPLSGCDHGTHVAGIAAGQNSSTVGVVPASSIVAIQAFEDGGAFCENGPGTCVVAFTSSLIGSLDHVITIAASMAISDVNMSLGTGPMPTPCNTHGTKGPIDALVALGIPTFATSGNNGNKSEMSAPACVDSAIAVGRVDDDHDVPLSSNSHPTLDLMAPGTNVVSSEPGNTFGTKSGTSMASPHAAGAFALLEQRFPSASSQQLLGCMTSTGIPITDPFNGVTKPLIQVAKAMSLGTPPATNDDFDDAVVLDDPSGTLAMTNENTTKQPGEPNHAGNPGGSSVWWKFTPIVDGMLTADVSGCTVSSVIAIYQGNAINQLTETSSGTGSTAASVLAGTEYHLAVDGVGGASGPSELQWSLVSAPSDDFASSAKLSGPSGSAESDNVGATKEAGEPNHAGDPGGASIWFDWTAPAGGTLEWTTNGSSFSALLAVYTGDEVDDLAEVGSTTQPTLEVAVAAGQTYRIAVDAPEVPSGPATPATAAQSTVTLSWQYAGVDNDAFADAESLTGTFGSVSGTNVGTTKQPGEPEHNGATGGASVWFKWTASSNGQATFDLTSSSFTSVLAAYTGPSVGSLTEVASAAASVSFATTAGVAYHVAVDGENGETGEFSLTWASAAPDPPTDVVATASSGKATVSWTASEGATGYAVTARPGNIVVPASAPSVVVDGLVNGLSYTFTVTASNAIGTSAPSVPSTPVIPTPPPPDGYWMLANDGEVYPFGEADDLGDATALGFPTIGQAVDIAATPSGSGYWIIDDLGGVHAYGDASTFGSLVGALAPGERLIAISPTPMGLGYWLFTDIGAVHAFGDAAFFGDVSHLSLDGPIVDAVATLSGRGYYMAANDGGVFALGDAPFHGSVREALGGGLPDQPIVALVTTLDSSGYWLVGADGGAFAFKAPFVGSIPQILPGIPLNAPVVGIVAFGGGYLMVATDGGIFNFSELPFLGSLGNNPPINPVISVAPSRPG